MDSPRDPYDDVVLVALAVALPLLVWWAGSGTVVTWLFQLKLAQLRLIEAAGFGGAATAELALALREALAAPDRLPFATFVFGMDAVGQYLRLPLCGGLLLLGGWLIVGHPAERFRRRYDLEALAEVMGAHWPFALHALRRGQRTLPLDDPRWGVALSAHQFAARHDLWHGEHPPTLRTGRALDALARQLGAPWAGAEPPLHIQALAGVFALRAASFTCAADAEADRLKQQSVALLRDLAWAAAGHKAGDYRPPPHAYQRVARITAPYLRTTAGAALIAQHAYTQTVLMRLLAEARQGGVLPAAWFTWLKGVDRPLWYALAALGRRVPFAEALGSVAHYQAERAAGTALHRPTVEAAVAALTEALAASGTPPVPLRAAP